MRPLAGGQSGGFDYRTCALDWAPSWSQRLGVVAIEVVNENPTLVKGESVEPEEHPHLSHT